MKEKRLKTGLCVVGGGLAGVCAAIAAARLGTPVVLVQDRPVLGGNASSEIRVWVRGASGENNREGGILRELELENIYRNPGMNFSVWDSVIYEKVVAEPNITLLLNCSVLDAECSDSVISSVRAWQLTTYTYYTIEADYFADCSGDSILAEPTGAKYRVGRESPDQFGEAMATEPADLSTMGMSCLLQARQTGQREDFIPPSFARRFDTDADFSAAPMPGAKNRGKDHDLSHDPNYWWIELGGDRDSIHDSDSVGRELQEVAYGIWDHIKNAGSHNADDYELEWVGALPGKRESRRYVGDYTLTANDLISGGDFSDTIAYGGWTMDNHDPRGFAAEGYTSKHYKVHSPYKIPYRCVYSVNIQNLFFAGRNISATHLALSSTRVMATCAIIGQAVGTAASLCYRDGITPRELGKSIGRLQSILMLNDLFLPGLRRPAGLLCPVDWKAARGADLTALCSGEERPNAKCDNRVWLEPGEEISCRVEPCDKPLLLHLVLDPDYSRKSISDNVKYQKFAMRCNVALGAERLKMPAALAKEINVLDGDGNVIFETDSNRRSLINIDLPKGTREVRVRIGSAWGGERAALFACEIIRKDGI